MKEIRGNMTLKKFFIPEHGKNFSRILEHFISGQKEENTVVLRVV